MGGVWTVVAAVLNALVELAKYLAKKPEKKPETEKAPSASSAKGAYERKQRELKKHDQNVEKTILETEEESPKKPSKAILN